MTHALNVPAEGVAPAVYQEVLSVMQQVFEDLQAERPLPGAGIFALADRLLQVLGTDGGTLVGLTAQTPTTHPMASHAVNTAIMAMATARGLAYDLPVLRDVGAAALLHDIGLVRLVDRGTAQAVAFADIKQHPAHAVALLGRYPELARLTAYLTPETPPVPRPARPHLAAPPLAHRLTKEDELRKIIRLADLYEALSHPRADGQPLAFAAVRTILTAHQLFEPRLIKALFDQVGIYPLGTWAQLSSGEIGLVTGVHPGMPLRPTVTIFYDRDGFKVIEPREVSLHEHPVIFIRRSLTQEPPLRA